MGLTSESRLISIRALLIAGARLNRVGTQECDSISSLNVNAKDFRSCVELAQVPQRFVIRALRNALCSAHVLGFGCDRGRLHRATGRGIVNGNDFVGCRATSHQPLWPQGRTGDTAAGTVSYVASHYPPWWTIEQVRALGYKDKELASVGQCGLASHTN